MSIFGRGLSGASDEQLVIEARQKNSAAFAELYDRYNQRIFHFLYRMTGYNRHKSQDFLQEVFLKVYENLNRFDETQKFSTWIFTIAHNLCRNEYRRIQVQKTKNGGLSIKLTPETDSTKEDPDQKIDREMLLNKVFNLIEELEAEQKSVFLLRFREHLSIKEIAQMMDCAVGTVKSRLHYAVKKIAGQVKDYNPNYFEVQK